MPVISNYSSTNWRISLFVLNSIKDSRPTWAGICAADILGSNSRARSYNADPPVTSLYSRWNIYHAPSVHTTDQTKICFILLLSSGTKLSCGKVEMFLSADACCCVGAAFFSHLKSLSHDWDAKRWSPWVSTAVEGWVCNTHMTTHVCTRVKGVDGDTV